MNIVESIENYVVFNKQIFFEVDLADWREDYNAHKYSTFLRELFTEHKRILSVQELEEEIYLSGIFEARALKVIKGLENTISKIEAIDKNNG